MDVIRFGRTYANEGRHKLRLVFCRSLFAFMERERLLQLIIARVCQERSTGSYDGRTGSYLTVDDNSFSASEVLFGPSASVIFS